MVPVVTPAVPFTSVRNEIINIPLCMTRDRHMGQGSSCACLCTTLCKHCRFQNNPVRTFLTNQSRVTINGLSPCLSYWVVVTATGCARVDSSPELLGVFDSANFQFAISLEDNTPCTVWIADNFARKISDVQNLISSELETSSCRMSIPCMANSDLTCEGNEINFE